METMKAVRLHAYGGPEVLVYEEAPRPGIGEGEVLIRVKAAGVNPLDWKVRAGHAREWLPHHLPLIPGWDVSGTVAAVGAGVTAFQLGDEVFGMLDFSRDGAYAEYVAAPAQDLARKPASLNHVQAAAVPLAGLTAWQGLFEVAALAPGQTVLIQAAAGGVGHYAVQFARWRGARVTGTASGANAEFIKQLGAHEVIDYRTTRFEEVVHEVDVVFDLLSGEVQQRSWQVLKKGGILVSTLGISSPAAAAEHGARGEFFLVHRDAAQLARIGELIDAGAVQPVVSKILPLTAAARAHELSQTGRTRGKMVLQVSD